MQLRHAGMRTATAGAIAVLSVLVAGVGIATASNGGSLVLGGHNAATRTTTLSDNKGTPLALVAKKGKAPLSVNSDGLVKNLNAGELGGLTAGSLSSGTTSQLKFSLLAVSSGDGVGVGLRPPTTGKHPSFRYTSIFNTKRLAAGNYQVNASVLGEGICVAGTTPPTSITKTYNYALLIQSSGTEGSINTTVRATKGQEIHLFCAGSTPPSPPATLGGLIIGGGMNVDRVQSLTAGQNASPDTAVGSLLRRK
jgi:hypothetical protein